MTIKNVCVCLVLTQFFSLNTFRLRLVEFVVAEPEDMEG